MIGSLTGKVIYKEDGVAIIDVNGVGYKVFVKQATMEELVKAGDKPVTLLTYLAVKEDSLNLYGFLHRETLEFFELLLTVSGIGPKSALSILNVAPVPAMRSAIASGDPEHLTKTTGIGTKKAEKIILELRDKIDMLESDVGSHREVADAIDALQALGYSRRESQDALKKVSHLITSTEAKIKEALKVLGK